MLVLSDKEVLPDIFLATKQFFDSTVEKINTFKIKVTEDAQPQTLVQTFFEKYNKYQMHGFNIFKTAMGDFCVGARALGNKFGALGGDSFVDLKEAAEGIVSKTGDFFNYMTNFIVSAEQVLNQSEQNVERFVSLVNTASEYLTSVSSGLEKMSNATRFLYGDAKSRLGERFASMSAPIVNFIHMAKVKVVSAIANCVVGIKIMFDNFVGIVQTQVELPLANYKLINEDSQIVNAQVHKFLAELIQEFDEALAQAKTIYVA
ncbi:MAG: hypothetical protein E7376_04900 [Clostridiales bacterium]|nr:hypothetical protein [Clostridiales bacterium]